MTCPGCLEDARKARERDYHERELERRCNNRPAVLRQYGVPRRHALLAFQEPSTWPCDSRLKALPLDKWAGTPWSVMLTGPVGTGKTSLAVELLFRFTYQGATARFVRASRVPTVFFSGNVLEQKHLETADLLVVDDLGKGHLGRAWEAIGEVLNARYDEEVSTLLTTNLTLREIAEHDIHLADRLSEGLVIEIDGESRRELIWES